MRSTPREGKSTRVTVDSFLTYVLSFVTIIADYRTLPNMQFPDPSKDIKDAIAYAVSHADEINSDAPVQADLDQIFVMGHSAGAAILASMFLLPDFLPIELKSRIRGAILKAGVYHFHTKTSGIPSDTITAYYGSAENISRNEPLALLDAASDDAVRSLPDILGVVSEYEVASVNESHLDFFNTLRKRTGEDYHQLVMKGHNHISPHIALCTGVGEQWANDVADWIKARVMKWVALSCALKQANSLGHPTIGRLCNSLCARNPETSSVCTGWTIFGRWLLMM